MAGLEDKDLDEPTVRVLGDNLQTATLRLVLILVGGSVVAGLISALFV